LNRPFQSDILGFISEDGAVSPRAAAISIQEKRVRNLAFVIAELEAAGITTEGSKVEALGGIVSARGIESRLNGRSISYDLARAIEHNLRKPRGWMDEDHAESAGVGVSKLGRLAILVAPDTAEEAWS